VRALAARLLLLLLISTVFARRMAALYEFHCLMAAEVASASEGDIFARMAWTRLLLRCCAASKESAEKHMATLEARLEAVESKDETMRTLYNVGQCENVLLRNANLEANLLSDICRMEQKLCKVFGRHTKQCYARHMNR